MNFTTPSAGKPALLPFSEVNTFLHEFGHDLHRMLANTTYSTMSGTSVYWEMCIRDRITMDADLQDSPDEIPELYRMSTEDGYDLVSGYKQDVYKRQHKKR